MLKKSKFKFKLDFFTLLEAHSCVCGGKYAVAESQSTGSTKGSHPDGGFSLVFAFAANPNQSSLIISGRR